MSTNPPKSLIETKNIADVAYDIGISQQTDGFLIFKSNADNITEILNKPFRSQYYTIMLVVEGTIALQINMFEYVLRLNNLIFVSPEAIKDFKTVSKDFSMIVILFTTNHFHYSPLNQSFADVFRYFAEKTHFFINNSLSNVEDIKHLATILQNRNTKNQKSRKVEDLIFYAILNVIEDILTHQKNNFPNERIDKRRNLIFSFFQLLPKHIRRHRTVNFYADKLNITSKYLTATLREETRKSASKHIANMVLLEAKVLLNNRNLSISEIADTLGFPDQFTFSKYFKRYSGINPSVYRGSFSQ